jgi:hypothetical protein
MRDAIDKLLMTQLDKLAVVGATQDCQTVMSWSRWTSQKAGGPSGPSAVYDVESVAVASSLGVVEPDKPARGEGGRDIGLWHVALADPRRKQGVLGPGLASRPVPAEKMPTSDPA